MQPLLGLFTQLVRVVSEYGGALRKCQIVRQQLAPQEYKTTETSNKHTPLCLKGKYH